MTDDPAAARLVLDALEHTRLRGSALIEFTFEASAAEIFASGATSERPRDGSLWRRSTGAMWRGALRIVFWGLRRVLERATKMTKGVLGVLDLEGHRCVYYPKPTEAELVVGDQRWTGAPGTAVDRLPARAASAWQPLWRRIRHTSGDASKGVMTSTLELTELGVALPTDWSRIPRSFRGA